MGLAVNLQGRGKGRLWVVEDELILVKTNKYDPHAVNVHGCTRHGDVSTMFLFSNEESAEGFIKNAAQLAADLVTTLTLVERWGGAIYPQELPSFEGGSE